MIVEAFPFIIFGVFIDFKCRKLIVSNYFCWINSRIEHWDGLERLYVIHHASIREVLGVAFKLQVKIELGFQNVQS